MGLLGWAKGVIIRREARQYGEVFAGNGGAVLDWLKRNKAKWGYAVGAVAAWCAAGCGEISIAALAAAVGIPITGTAVISPLDILHRIPVLASLSCGHVTFGVGVGAAFLVGAGIMTSDHHEAVIQGLKPPAGPPESIDTVKDPKRFD